jgi:hypothetical protein
MSIALTAHMQSSRWFLFFLWAGLAEGCAAVPEFDKGNADPAPIEGAADSALTVIDHGSLVFSTSSTGTLGPAGQVHAWTFELFGPATLAIRTLPPREGAPEVDTILSVFRQTDGGWGEPIFTNDDSSGTLWSAISSSLEAGTYRVLVRGYRRTATGDFGLIAECEGAGCESQLDASGCNPEQRPLGGGSGTEADPFLVCSARHLERIGDSPFARYFRLTRDLDVRDQTLRSIARFFGVFDGGGHRLIGLRTNDETSQERALFIDQHGIVRDFHLVDVDLNATAGFAVYNYGLLSRVSVAGRVTGAGIVGTNHGTIVHCEFEGTAVDGAIAKKNSLGRIIHSRAHADVHGQSVVGGIASLSSGWIHDTHFEGTVDGQFAGGIVGIVVSGSVLTNSSSRSTIRSIEFRGGIVAEQQGDAPIHACFYEGRIEPDRTSWAQETLLVGMSDRPTSPPTDCYGIVRTDPGAWELRSDGVPLGSATSSYLISITEGPTPRTEGWLSGRRGSVDVSTLANVETFSGFDSAVWNLDPRELSEHGRPRLAWESHGTEPVDMTFFPVTFDLSTSSRASFVHVVDLDRRITRPVPVVFTRPYTTINYPTATIWLEPGRYDFWIARDNERSQRDSRCTVRDATAFTVSNAPVNPRASFGCAATSGEVSSYHPLGGPMLGRVERELRMVPLPVAPPPRRSHIMAYDAANERVVLFGGAWDRDEHADTWLYDGSAWVEQHPAHRPPSARGACAAYDALRQEVVMFGGSHLRETHSSELLDATWVWDGTDWTQRSSSTRPSARARCTMTWDSARGVVVMFGGRGTTGPSTPDTWEWNGENWVRATPLRSPPASSSVTLAYDEARQRSVLYEGNERVIWEYDGASWERRLGTLIQPLTEQGMASVYDPITRSVLIVGGGVNTGGGPVGPRNIWSWNGNWSVFPGTQRSDGAIVWDAARQRAVYFGGSARMGYDHHNDDGFYTTEL